jgi:hypothetical protein
MNLELNASCTKITGALTALEEPVFVTAIHIIHE